LLGHLGSIYDFPSPMADWEVEIDYHKEHQEHKEQKEGCALCALRALRGTKIENLKKPLHAIISQTKRIHQLLTDLMQFARPPRPFKQPVDVAALVREVAVSMQELALQRQVRLIVHDDEVTESTAKREAQSAERRAQSAECEVLGASRSALRAPLMVDADRHQLTTAVACLLRNAIEAAPTEGWASIGLETPAQKNRAEVVVLDSGSGPALPQREHLFDPFYSGRSAGRGRGLGLATAWRLAREHGGDVRFDSVPGGPTRFILSLPLSDLAPERNGSNK
jgi:two-component system NtrC family sensor kinase